jgi:hypothetical protein
MTPAAMPILLDRLTALRTELVDLAYTLDLRGAVTAADVAMTTSSRLAELCEEFSAPPGNGYSDKNSTPRTDISAVVH